MRRSGRDPRQQPLRLPQRRNRPLSRPSLHRLGGAGGQDVEVGSRHGPEVRALSSTAASCKDLVVRGLLGSGIAQSLGESQKAVAGAQRTASRSGRSGRVSRPSRGSAGGSFPAPMAGETTLSRTPPRRARGEDAPRVPRLRESESGRFNLPLRNFGPPTGNGKVPRNLPASGRGFRWLSESSLASQSFPARHRIFSCPAELSRVSQRFPTIRRILRSRTESSGEPKSLPTRGRILQRPAES